MEDGVFFREVLCNGQALKVKQLYIGDVGCVVWDAALVLCRFLENKQYFPGDFWSGKRVLELGAGTGVVGLAAGTLGADVIVTDLAECVDLMRSNIELNRDCISGHVSARSLVWGEDVTGIADRLDVILMSDVVYYKEVLHAAFALGAFLAPLIAKPFITDIPDTQENLNTSLVFNISCSNAWTSNCDNISSVECACIDSIAEICSETSSAIVVLSTTSNCSVIEEQTDSITLKYGWAYWISALFFVIPLLVFIYYSIRFDIIPRFKTNRNNDISKVGRQTEESLETTKAEESPEGSQVELNEVAAVDNEKLLEEDGNIVVVRDSTSSKGPVVLKTYKYPAFFLLFWFMLFYVGSEVSYGSLLFTFSVKSQLQFDKQTAATVTAVFWGLFMFMRVFSILLVVLKVRASVMMTLNVSGSVTAILILAIFPHNHISVWIASSLLGASFASVFPTAMTWMSEHLPVSGKAIAVLNSGGNIGDIVLPSVIAALIGNVHPDSFVYSVLTLITLSTTLLVLLFTMTFVYQRRHKPHDKSVVGYNRLQTDGGESLENGGLISSGVFEETEPTENEEAIL